MLYLRSTLLFAAALATTLVSHAVPYSMAPNHHGGGGGTPNTASGVYAVTFTISVTSTLPANSIMICKAQIVPSQGGMEGFNYLMNAVPLESAAVAATVSGNTATCALQIPFSWAVSGNQTGVQLSYEIDAVNPVGSLPAVVRTSSQQGISEPYPAGGGTSSLSFSVTF